jgi:hypothetical protein
MKRGTKPMARTTKIKPRSKKMAAAYTGTPEQEGRRALVNRLLTERPMCEAGAKIAAAYAYSKTSLSYALSRSPTGRPIQITTSQGKLVLICTGNSVDVHEILPRSAKGSILDEANLLCVCRPCHEWITLRANEAMALGLRVSRFGEGMTRAKSSLADWSR